MADPHSHDHDHSHGHDHDHDHAPITDPDRPVTEYEVLEQALRELLIEKGMITALDVNQQIDATDSRNPVFGAKIVAKAWADPVFKEKLKADPRSTMRELDIEIGHVAELRVVENTANVHHVVVCTLCSCYPRMILGVPPAWYKSTSYRSRVVSEPRSVLSEFGLELSNDTEIRVLDSTADLRFLVIPERPDGTDTMSEDDLAGLVTRDTMIGTARASAS
ncbi:MAG: nitrile hydratase subunit alpha [Pseudomonadota bacterium]